jgi:hypothetical protein
MGTIKEVGKNIQFDYLYRDAGNYKIFNSLIFPNQHCLSVLQLEQLMKIAFIDELYFEPIAWGIPTLSFPDFDEDLDHEWHEVEKISVTEKIGYWAFNLW